MAAKHFSDDDPVAAHWGQGVTRRAFRLAGNKGRVEAALEDHCHSMRCLLEHDSVAISAVEADFRRYTLGHCPAAALPLKELVGMPIATSTRDFFSGGRARRNCTHMLDLAWLAMRHAGRGHAEWVYEIEIPDAPKGAVDGTLCCNGEEVLRWTVEDDIITSTGVFEGRALWGGFLRWLTDEAGLSDLEVEHALVLHKGFFMVSARRLEMRPGPLAPAHQAQVVGRCFGYAPERIGNAIGEAGMFRDFSEDREGLLRFE